jgi:hypothetical protein
VPISPIIPSLPVSAGLPPSERPQRAQNPQEHRPHEHRDDAQHARVGDVSPQQQKAPTKQRKDAPRSEEAVAENVQVYYEEHDPDKDQNRPYRRGRHHR